MMNAIIPVISLRFALCLLLFGVLRAHTTSGADLDLAIVPADRNVEFTAISLNPGDNTFHVVLANRSASAINVWKEWCRWGYFALTFELQFPDGTTMEIEKRPTEWEKNFPDAFLIPPGSYFVLPVIWTDEIWQNLPAFRGQQEVRLRARYRSKFDPNDLMERNFVKGPRVFDGEVESPWIDVTLFR